MDDETDTTPEAEAALAVKALAFLAGNERHAAHFLNATGLDAADIPSLVKDRDFQVAVLDFLLHNEPLLLAFAQSEGLDPKRIWPARDRLAGEFSQYGQ